jgi:hypothetical protein
MVHGTQTQVFLPLIPSTSCVTTSTGRYNLDNEQIDTLRFISHLLLRLIIFFFINTMRQITHLPTDILLYIGEFLNKPQYFGLNHRYVFAAVVNDQAMIQHYLQKNNNDEKQRMFLMNSVASIGNLAMVQWLHNTGCPWDASACKEAASNGNLEVLKYLHDNGCPWDSCACAWAAWNGELEVLKYLHTNGCPWDEDTFSNARGDDVIEYLISNGCPRRY